MSLALTELNAFTQQELKPKTVDVIFKQSPLLTRLLARNRIAFPGGTLIQQPLTYAELNGDAYAKGETFNTAFVKTETAVQVYMKYYYVNVTLYGVDDVLNRGRNTAFSQAEVKMANASMKMAKLLSQAIYRDGQTAAMGTVLSTTKHLDGLLAWIDDGSSNGSYTTSANQDKAFAAVGGITRADLFPSALTFSTTTTPNSALQGLNAFVNRAYGTFSLNTIQDAFGAAWYGNDYPDMMVGTQTGWNKTWQALQPNQRYYGPGEVDVAKVGFKSFRFNGVADVVVDKYMPQDGTNGMMLGLNTNYIQLHITDNPKWQFGFTGFKDSRNDPDLAGQFLFAGNMLVPNPRTCFKLVGTALL